MSAKDKVKELRDKALALTARRHRVTYEDLDVDILEPSVAVMRQFSKDEDGSVVNMLRTCIVAPGTDDPIFADCTDSELEALPWGFARALQDKVLELLSRETEKTIRGNSDSTAAASA